MLDELDQPTLVEVIKEPANVGVKNIVHLPLQERIRQRIQRIMLAAPRAKSIREAEKVFLVNLVEDGGHSLLDQLVFQGRNPQWASPPIGFLFFFEKCTGWRCPQLRSHHIIRGEFCDFMSRLFGTGSAIKGAALALEEELFKPEYCSSW